MAEQEEDVVNTRVDQPVDHIVSALIQHLRLIEEGFDENRLQSVVRSDARYGRAASSIEASQVLTTAIIEFNRTWTQNYQLDTIIKRSGL